MRSADSVLVLRAGESWLLGRLLGGLLLCLGVLIGQGCSQSAQENAGVTTTSLHDTLDSPPSAGESPAAIPPAGALVRKIVYTADVELAVDDFGDMPDRIEKLVREFNGYVAHSSISSSPRRPRSGNWTARIPADRFSDFLDAVRELGEVQRVGTDSKDVTEEFYDVETRIKNKQLEEQRLLKLLEDATGELEQVLAVERELSRVRGEVEQLQGRMRVLEDLTSLTTVEIRVEELKGYIPEESASYLTRLRRAWGVSLTSLYRAAQAVSIFLIAAAPWFVALLVPIILFVWIVRRIRRRRTARLA